MERAILINGVVKSVNVPAGLISIGEYAFEKAGYRDKQSPNYFEKIVNSEDLNLNRRYCADLEMKNAREDAETSARVNGKYVVSEDEASQLTTLFDREKPKRADIIDKIFNGTATDCLKEDLYFGCYKDRYVGGIRVWNHRFALIDALKSGQFEEIKKAYYDAAPTPLARWNCFSCMMYSCYVEKVQDFLIKDLLALDSQLFPPEFIQEYLTDMMEEIVLTKAYFRRKASQMNARQESKGTKTSNNLESVLDGEKGKTRGKAQIQN